MQHEEQLKHLISWQEKIDYLAVLFCQDEKDRELVKAETYDLISAGLEYPELQPANQFGDYVLTTDYRKLAERFLLAMELISVMEQNLIIRDQME